MKKNILIAFILATTSLTAQTYMPVPRGSFEQWENHPGDSISLMGMITMPIFGSYSTPTGWYIPTYSINETLDFSGFNIPVNLDIPLACIRKDSSTYVPDSSAALVLKTFKLNDIFNPEIVGLASNLLDQEIVDAIIPSIAATGQFDVNKLLPLMESLISGQSNLSWLLDMMDTVDLNEYISGGFPLNGFEPTSLKGSFKFLPPIYTDLDYGTVLAIGTRYDTLTHRRILVSAGSHNLFPNIDGDSLHYYPFEVEIASLTDYYPAEYAYYTPDTMIIVAVSSTSEKRLQGSQLFIDSLFLEHTDPPCGRIDSIYADSITTAAARIHWTNTLVPTRWEVEYGRQGFARGHGTTREVSDSTIYIIGLGAATTYEIYIRTICDDDTRSSWSYYTFTTESEHQSINQAATPRLNVFPNPAHGYCTIDLGNLKQGTLRLYTIEGRLIDEKAVHDNQINVALPHNGIFIIEYRNADTTLRQRIINK